MPVYAYGCKNCGHEFDIRQSFTDDALTECPECGGQLRKKFNTVGVVFKGSGFYRNDSRSDPTGSAASSDSKGSEPAAAASTSSSSSSSEKTATSSTAASSSTTASND